MKKDKWYTGLEPAVVFEYFDRISEIPRGSGNVEAISDAVVSWIRDMGLRAEKDRWCNVKAFKPASSGYENADAVMLAAHLDMVCAKTADSDHDFMKDPIRILIDDDGFITADGTSLGADDGMGAAMILAILSDNSLSHPAIEAVFTADEETDMKGALNLDYSDLKSKLIISLDGDPVGIAGLGELDIIESFAYREVPCQDNAVFFRATVSGLKGGHSGMEAKKERGNAVLIMGRLLSELSQITNIYIADIKAGNDSASAIAYHAEAVIGVPAEDYEIACETADKLQAILSDELKKRDENVCLSISREADPPKTVIDKDSTERLLDFLMLVPDGVMSMNFDYPGLMESSINTGVVDLDCGKIVIRTTIRSANASRKAYIFSRVRRLCRLLDMDVDIENDLPQWDMRVSDDILNLCRKVFPDCSFIVEEGTGECGIFTDRMPMASAITIQCPYTGAHSTEEKISASLTGVYYDRMKVFLSELR